MNLLRDWHRAVFHGAVHAVLRSDTRQVKRAGSPEAETRIKSSLVLEQIAKDEKIEITDEELDAEIEKMAAQYGMEADKDKRVHRRQREGIHEERPCSDQGSRPDHGEREGESESKIQERKRSRRERGNRGVIPLSVLIAKQTDWLYWAGLFKLISNY